MSRKFFYVGVAWLVVSGVLIGAGLYKAFDSCKCGNICNTHFSCGLKSCPSNGQPKAAQQSPDLKEIYNQYNLKYFRNWLPANTLVVWGEPGEKRMGLTRKDEYGRFEIVISRRYNVAESTTDLTVLHEMVHVESWDKTLEHGPAFQKEMHRLADEGAMEDLW